MTRPPLVAAEGQNSHHLQPGKGLVFADADGAHHTGVVLMATQWEGGRSAPSD